jgi:hypothetical protein
MPVAKLFLEDEAACALRRDPDGLDVGVDHDADQFLELDLRFPALLFFSPAEIG